MAEARKFAALFDVHWGYESKGGHKIAIHNPRQIKAVLAFLKDFKPDTIILGGDILDCQAVSHYNKSKPGKVEGLRLLADAQECRKELIVPLEGLTDDLTYIVGNHEDWLQDLVDEQPGLEGIVEIGALLKLDKWDVIEQGKGKALGKLYFMHGDQISNADAKAKQAVVAYERSVRFGHFHTYQVYTKTAAVDSHAKSGVAVPCLCRTGLDYMEGKPSSQVNGFNWGYVYPDGTFTDYVTIITNNRFTANGKTYHG